MSDLIHGTAGQIFKIKNIDIAVCCGNGSYIRLRKLEINGTVVDANLIITSNKVRLI